MENRVCIGRHPVHPMLVPFPIALWIFSLVCDLVFYLGWGGAPWANAAFYTMAGGIVGALAAALPGIFDYKAILIQPAKRIATWHLIMNLTLVVLYAINLWLRTAMAPGAVQPIILSVIGVALLGVSGWLGGELVYVHAVGVSPAVDKEMKSAQQRRRAV